MSSRDTIVDWHAATSIAGHAQISTRSGATGADHPVASITDLIAMARTNSSQNSAIQTIIQGMELDACRNTGPHAETELRAVAGHIVENAMILGYVAWRPGAAATNHMPVIAAPGDVDIAWRATSATTGTWVPVASKRAQWLRGTTGWRLEMFDEPFRPDSISMHASVRPTTIDPHLLRSPCARSYTAAARQQLIEHQWLCRDKFNSSPSAFTSIRKDFGNTEGKMRPWFRDVNAGAASALHTASAHADVDDPQDFRALISNRADTIRQLSAHTAIERNTMERRNAMKAATTAHGRAEAAYGMAPINHNEFAISDGKEIKPAPTLLSTIDGHMQFSRSRHTVLILMGVPPQAIGESVNSERNASNHRQYEVAMSLFHATMRKFRMLINRIMGASECSAVFVAALPTHTLESVGPVMSTESLKRRFSETHNIDIADIDSDRLKLWQNARLADEGGGGAENGDPDVRQSGLDKKKAKRNNVEPNP